MKRIRLIHWVNPYRIRIFISGITLCVIFFTIWWYQQQCKATSTDRNLQQIKVLIIYSSGNPDAIVPHLSEDINVITLPTPKFVNTAVIAKMIANHMKNDMFHVTLKKIGEIKRVQEVLFADVILIGSATHFTNMDWQTKRFFDETLYPFYVHYKTKLKDKYIGCFTTSGCTYSGKHCIKSIHRTLYDYGSKELPSLIITDKTPQNDVEKKVIQFTKKLIVKLENVYKSKF